MRDIFSIKTLLESLWVIVVVKDKKPIAIPRSYSIKDDLQTMFVIIKNLSKLFQHISECNKPLSKRVFQRRVKEKYGQISAIHAALMAAVDGDLCFPLT